MTSKSKRFLVLIAVVGAVSAAGGYLLAKRPAPAADPKVALSAQAPSLELAATDVMLAQRQTLTQGLAVSGTLKAVNSAVVKARVAGELQGLLVREGDTVQPGQVLGRIDSTEYQARLQQARQQADAARAQKDIAQRQFDNNQALVNQGFISRTALDTSLASLQAAEATFRAALAAADVSRKALDDTVVKAPIAGQVAQRLAQSGERMAIDGRILEIVDGSRLELEANFSPAESVLLKAGQQAVLRVEGSDQPLVAKLLRINPSAQAASRSVTAYFSLQAGPQTSALRQGLFMQGTLSTGSTEAVAVPLSALRTDKPAPYVQVVQGGRVLHQRVAPGARGMAGGLEMVAVQGLAEQSLVIHGAIGALPEGIQVRFTSPPPGAQPAAVAGS